jgi:hypothetical protein
MSEESRSRNGPSELGRCTECGSVYPIRSTEGGWSPVGTDGVCRCGNTEFVPVESA